MADNDYIARLRILLDETMSFLGKAERSDAVNKIIKEIEDNPPRVLIVVEGGVVQDTIADGPVRTLVKDFDNLEEGAMFNPDGFHRNPVFDAAAFKDEVLGDVPVTQLELSGGPFTFQISLKGWQETEDSNLIKWINAPSTHAFKQWLDAQTFEIEDIDSDIELIGPFAVTDGVDIVLDAEGKVLEGEIGVTKPGGDSDGTKQEES